MPSADFAGVPIHMDTCFEREPEYWAGIPVLTVLTDDYALDGDFATGVDGSAIILAIYQQHQGKIWDYAERCNTAEFYKSAIPVKKLRTVSMAGPDSNWRGGGPFSGSPGGGPHGGGKNGGIGPSSFGYAPPGGGIFSFSGGGGSGSGSGGPGDEGPGKQLASNTEPSDDGKTSPDDKDDPGPGEENPTNPGGGGETNNPTVLPEPGTLALFLSLAAGFGVMRRRVSRGSRA